jgi:uncharacterized protein YjbI with pentapeptide repeats/uncharacterized MnhB-related membrane protein
MLSTVVVGVLVLLCAVIVAVRHSRRDSRQRDPDAVPLVTALVVFGIVALTIGVQLAIEPAGEPKTVLTTAGVGAGLVTAVFALWLNHRRYRVEEARQQVERDKADLDQRRHQLEQRKVELEHAKDRREHDKVVDDAVIRVVELFGHAEQLVRCGALHMLAGFAAQRPERAREVVRLVCMYLRRMPPGDEAGGEAQMLLSRVVRQANAATPPAVDLDVDLTGARLTGFVLEDVSLRVLTLTGARLSGVTSLRGLGAGCRVELDSATFEGDVRLHSAHLSRLFARKAEFGGDLSVTSSTVDQDVVLSEASIEGDVDFSRARIGTLAASAVTVGGEANFRRATVEGGTTFLQAHFGRADFESFTCGTTIVFDGAHFAGTVRLPSNGTSSGVSLRRTTVATVSADLPPPWRVTTVDGVHYLTVSSDSTTA